MTPPVVILKEDWNALKEQALMAQRSGLLPKAIDTPDKAIVIAMAGRELGLGPWASLTGLYVVNGMVALKGALMLRLIYERVPGARITILTKPERALEECEVEMARPGGALQRFRFTLDDAKKAGLLSKQPWQQHPATMLRWAAIRTGARIMFPDALAGCYMEDEVSKEVSAPIEEGQFEEPKLIEHRPNVSSVTLEGEIKPTDKQLSRLSHLAKDSGWSKEEIKKYSEQNFGKSHSKDLSLLEYNKLCDYLMMHSRGSRDFEPGELDLSLSTEDKK